MTTNVSVRNYGPLNVRVSTEGNDQSFKEEIVPPGQQSSSFCLYDGQTVKIEEVKPEEKKDDGAGG